MNFKKLLAITLVLAMVLSFMPTFAFADDEIVTEEPASEAAAEEPVVEEDPVVEEEPEAPQEEPETWDAPEDVVPEEPVEEPEVGATPYVTFYYDGTKLCSYQATAGSKTGEYYMDADSLAKAQAAAEKAHPGYEFLGWQYYNDERVLTPIELDSAHPFAGSLDVYADFSDEVETFTVTYAVSPNKAPFTDKLPNPVTETVAYGGSPAWEVQTVVEGYDFKGFYVNGVTDPYDALDEIEVTKAITITATWEATPAGPHTVTFDYTGATQDSIVGSQVELNKVEVTVNDGEKIPTSAYNAKPTSVNAADHVFFDKWDNDDFEVTDAITEDGVIFTATWKTEEFTVSYDGYAEKSESVPYNGHAKGFTPKAPDNQKFVGWSLTKGGTEAVSLATYPITKATTFYPIFSAETVKVTFYYRLAVEGAYGEPEQFAEQNVPYGGTATNPGEPEDVFGYHVDKWTTDEAGEKPFSFSTKITEAINVYAFETGNKYTLEINTTGITGDVYYGTTSTGADKPLSNPVDTIEVYAGNDGTAFENVLLIKAKGYDFSNGYTYKYYDAGEKKVVDMPFPGGYLLLDKDMQFTAGSSANAYKLVLTPETPVKVWTVDFVSKYGTKAIGVGEEFAAPSSFDVKQTDTEKVTDARLTVDGTVLKDGVVADQIIVQSEDGKDYFLEGWYTDAAFTTKYNFNAYVKSSMTLYAKWLPFQTVTFNLTAATATVDPAHFVDPDDPTAATASRIVIKDMSLTDMETLVEKYPDTLGEYLGLDYTTALPKATRETFDTLKWLNGTTEFSKATKVTADLTLTDNWSVTTWTVKFDTKGGKPEIANVTVHNGKTVPKQADITKENFVFDGWEYTPSGETEAVPFVFDGDEDATEVTENITVVATWTAAEAKIGTVYYETLAEALAVEGDKTVELVKDVVFPENAEPVLVNGDATLKFGDKTVTGGVFELEEGSTLTVTSGTFENVVFIGGIAEVEIEGGTFLESHIYAHDLTIDADAKFDASTARWINWLHLLDGEILAVTAASTDGYYRCVDERSLTFNFNGVTVVDGNGTDSDEPIVISIGLGETPAHAISEYVEMQKEIYHPNFKDAITKPAPAKEFEYLRFNTWAEDVAGENVFNLNAAFDGDVDTVYADWVRQYTVSFFVYGNPYWDEDLDEYVYDEAEYSVKVDEGAKVTAWDASEVIAEHNQDVGPTQQDVFEFWYDWDTWSYEEFDFANTTIDSDVALKARMKCRVVFDYQDQKTAPVVIQANHGDRYSKYSKQIPEGNWVDTRGNLLNPNVIISDYTESVRFVPFVIDNANWNLISVSYDKGFTYKYDEKTATGNGAYKGKPGDPVVVTAQYIYDETGNSVGQGVVLGFRIEAPASVKSWNDFDVQVDNHDWETGNKYSDDLSPNKNYCFYLSERMTVEQIKDAAKAGKTFTFTMKFRPAATASNPNPDPVASFTFTFDPANLKINNYTSTGELPHSGVLVITDGKYEYSLKYKMNGGTSLDPTGDKTLESGTIVMLPANPTSTTATFYRWSGSDNTEYYGGYTDKNGRWVAEGYELYPDYFYGGALDEDGDFIPNSFIMTEDVTFEAEYTTDPATVQITDNGFVTTDGSFTMTSLISEVAAKLPEPKEKAEQLFKEWQVKDAHDAHEVIWLAIDTVPKTVKISDYAEDGTLDIKAVYYDPANDPPDGPAIMTFMSAGEEVHVGKQPVPAGATNVAASKFYNQSVKDVEASIELFKYWTSEKPDDNGRWPKAPAEYKWATETVPVAGKTVYAYVPYTEYTVKIHPAGGGVNEIKVEHGKTIPPEDIPVVEGQVGWSTVDPATAQPVDFPADTPIKADTEIWAYYEIFSVMYDANGGKGAPEPQTKVFGIDLELTKDEPTLIGREFLGWAKTATATEPEFKGGDKYKDNKDVTLYAVWSEGEPVTEFVKRAYSLILGREADQEGLDYWVKGLKDKTFKGGDIVSQFMNSDEYVLANHPNAEAVTAVYKTMLDREPDAEGQAYWVGLLDLGCSYNMIINGFCDSAEFKGICEQYGIEPGTVATERRDENPKLTGFVSRNYKCALNRTGDSFGLNYWAGQLLDKAQTPYEVAHGFVFSEECVGRNLNNTQFVTMLYKLYMDRDPEADGLAYWVGQLDNKTMTREEVEKGFADSPEFAEIIKSYGL